MAIDGLAIGGTPGVPTNVVPLAGPVPLNDDIAVPAAPAAGDDALVGAVADAAEIAVTAGLQVLSVVKSPVNVAGAMVEALKEVVPGAKLLGDWQVPQVMAVKEAIADIPKSYLPWFHGVTIRLVPRGGKKMNGQEEDVDEKIIEERKLVFAEVSKREIRVREEAFSLPEIGGVPGFRLALVGELGKLGAAKPANVQEFARLSGWTQTVRDADGRLVEAPRPTAGAVPGEAPIGAPTRGLADPEADSQVPVWRPEGSREPGVGRGPARPAGTQGLSPSETSRLRPCADPRRAPGTAPLGDTGALGPDPRFAGRPADPRAAGLPAGGRGADAPQARSGEGPHARTGEGPHGRTGEPPHARTGEAPHGRPGEAPHGRPGEAPHGRPGEAPHGRPGEAPHGRPGEAPHGRPGEASQARSGEFPQGRSSEAPHGRPGDAPAGRAAGPTRPGEAPATREPGRRSDGGPAQAPIAPNGQAGPTPPGQAGPTPTGQAGRALADQPGPALAPAQAIDATSLPAARSFGPTAADPGADAPFAANGAPDLGAPAARPNVGLAAFPTPAGSSLAPPPGPGGRGPLGRPGAEPFAAGPAASRGEPGLGGRPAPTGRRIEPAGSFSPTAAPTASGPGGEVPGARPGLPGRAGGTTPLPTATRPGFEPRRGAVDLGPRQAGGPGRPGVARASGAVQAAPGKPERIEGGSRIQLGNQNVLEFHHDAGAGFVGGPHAELDPRADFGESLKSFLFKPEALLGKATAKFLFLNAETRQYSAAQVQAMAKAAGVDLGKVVTDLLVSGRASQATISRICEHHGLAADAVALRAKDQQVLAKGANVESLVGRLALDLGANGPATAKAVREAEALQAAFDKLAARLPVGKDPARVGMATGSGVFAWIASRAARLGDDRLSRVDAELGELRSQFQRLPLAAQLKVDPRLALGAGWFRFSPEERKLLTDPQAVQGLVARATERIDEVGYIPQRLNASEKRALATRTVIEALFDPSAAGAAFRARLGVPDRPFERGHGAAGVGGPRPDARKPDLPGDPLAALRDLPARNGEAALGLLDDGQRKALGDKRAAAAIKAVLADPALGEALATLRRGATGSEAVRTAVLKYALEQGRKDGDLVAAIKGAVEAVKSEKARFMKGLDGSALELALTETNRQVQEGNVEFVQRFVADSPEALEDALGSWVWQALSDPERKLLEDPGYRRHLVEDAKTLRATGASLAEEARQFRIETENIQQTLDFLVRPDQTFRKEFATDPVGALTRRGIFPHLPDPIKKALAEGDKITQIQQLTKAVEQTLQPIIQRQIGHQKQLENLRAAIKTVNAGNYKPILGILDLGEADMTRAVRTTLTSAMSHGDKEIRGGIISFI